MHTFLCIHTYIYAYIYMCIYLYTHTHVYIHPIDIFAKIIVFHRDVPFPFPPTSDFGVCVGYRGAPLFLLWGGFD